MNMEVERLVGERVGADSSGSRDPEPDCFATKPYRPLLVMDRGAADYRCSDNGIAYGGPGRHGDRNAVPRCPGVVIALGFDRILNVSTDFDNGLDILPSY